MTENELAQIKEMIQEAKKDASCPHCGYCQHCGRAGHVPYQVYPAYPAYPYPWYTSPNISWTVSGTQTVAGVRNVTSGSTVFVGANWGSE